MFSPRSPFRGVLARSGFPTSSILSRLVQLIVCFPCSPSVIYMSRCTDTCFTMLCSWIKGLESSRPPLVQITRPLPHITYVKLTWLCRFTISHESKVISSRLTFCELWLTNPVTCLFILCVWDCVPFCSFTWNLLFVTLRMLFFFKVLNNISNLCRAEQVLKCCFVFVIVLNATGSLILMSLGCIMLISVPLCLGLQPHSALIFVRWFCFLLMKLCLQGREVKGGVFTREAAQKQWGTLASVYFFSSCFNWSVLWRWELFSGEADFISTCKCPDMLVERGRLRERTACKESCL